jgi:hypothetical protein
MASIAIIAHWELPAALKNPRAQKKLYVHWSHTAKALGCTRIALVDVDGDCPEFGDAEINLTLHSDLADAIANTPGQHVYVEQGGAPMSEYVHPEDATYIFGSDYGELPQADVAIDTEGPLHAMVAFGIVLCNRKSQWP